MWSWQENTRTWCCIQKKLTPQYGVWSKTLATNNQALTGAQLKSPTYYMGKVQILHWAQTHLVRAIKDWCLAMLAMKHPITCPAQSTTVTRLWNILLMCAKAANFLGLDQMPRARLPLNTMITAHPCVLPKLCVPHNTVTACLLMLSAPLWKKSFVKFYQ